MGQSSLLHKIGRKNIDDLADGIYYYCGHCKYWFGTRKPAINQKCPSCGWLWSNAEGIYIKETNFIKTDMPRTQPQTSNSTVVVIITFLLVGVFWIYSVVQPRVLLAWRSFQVGWSHFVREVTLGVEFIGSIFLSFVALTGATLLLFGLLRLSVYLIILVLFSIVSLFPTNKHYYSVQDRARRTMQEHGRLIGTLINLVSSFCALLIVSWVFQRPPDYWDFGIQFVIALVIEAVILSI